MENPNELFSLGFDSYPEELLKDLLQELNEKNKKELEKISRNGFNYHKFKSRNGCVQNIITICDIFEQNDCVKYCSIELFDKLIVKLVCDTKEIFFKSNANPFDWKLIESKMSKQMHLRAISCIVIASKLYNCHNCIDFNEVKALLEKSGHKYSLKNLNKSEIRVLKLFDFKLMITSIETYVQLFLSILNHNLNGFQTTIDMNLFFKTAKHLTDLYYMCRNIIIRNAYKIMSKGLSLNQTDEELEIEKIGANKMLISSAIIASIPIIIDVSINELVINELSDISGIRDNKIIDMSHAILVLICDY
jgi:hypothetical protein